MNRQEVIESIKNKKRDLQKLEYQKSRYLEIVKGINEEIKRIKDDIYSRATYFEKEDLKTVAELLK